MAGGVKGVGWGALRVQLTGLGTSFRGPNVGAKDRGVSIPWSLDSVFPTPGTPARRLNLKGQASGRSSSRVPELERDPGRRIIVP